MWNTTKSIQFSGFPKYCHIAFSIFPYIHVYILFFCQYNWKTLYRLTNCSIFCPQTRNISKRFWLLYWIVNWDWKIERMTFTIPCDGNTGIWCPSIYMFVVRCFHCCRSVEFSIYYISQYLFYKIFWLYVLCESIMMPYTIGTISNVNIKIAEMCNKHIIYTHP